MPCRSDYMEPTPQEKEASKLVVLLDEIRAGKPIPDNYGDGYDERVYNKGAAGMLNSLTETLCSLLKAEKNIDKYSLEMRIWWRDHQKADKKREQDENESKRMKKIRDDAMSKLTEEEKMALGL